MVASLFMAALQSAGVAARGANHGKAASKDGRKMAADFAAHFRPSFACTCIGCRRRMARRIAIVEDDAAIRANYAEALKRHGYEVAAYAARAEAMQVFRSRLPDLAIIDIGLGDDSEGGFA